MGRPRAETTEKRAPRFERREASVRKQELIDAAIRCLSKGGIAAFTIDRICGEAGVSRGLINHHFDGKNALLASAYESMTAYLDMTRSGLSEPGVTPEDRLAGIIDASFEGDGDRGMLRAWLALWGEVSSTPEMRATHRARHASYQAGLAESIAEIAERRGRPVDAETLALTLIALIDGLWIEWCLDSSVLSEEQAKAACFDLLEGRLGAIRT